MDSPGNAMTPVTGMAPAEMRTDKYSELGKYVRKHQLAAEEERKPQEQKFVDNYCDYMRIQREDDTKGSGLPKADKSAKQIFSGQTKAKIRAARAKIKDVLFSNGDEVPFDTEPVNDEVAPFEETMEAILRQQLLDGDFVHALGTVSVGQGCLHGTMHLAGPFTRRKSMPTMSVDQFGMLAETEYSYFEPYFEAPLTMDVFPDANATDSDFGYGTIWTLHYSPETVKNWKEDGLFFNIDEALARKETARANAGSDLVRSIHANVQPSQDGRIAVSRYFGLVPQHLLADMAASGGESGEVEEPGEPVESLQDEGNDLEEVVVWFVKDVVIRVDRENLSQRRIYRGVYEHVDGEYWGVGIAENNSTSLKIKNAAFRLFVMSKGLALNPPCSVDTSMYEAGEDFKIYPNKIYRFKRGLSAEQRKEAILWHIIPDVSEGWESLIQHSEQESDDDTGLTKYQQGSDAQNLNKTAHGISMIMNSASLPLKEVLMNIDTQLIEPAINALIEWNLKYLEPQTVAMIHGPEMAQRWAKIKQFGKTSFMKWRSTGASTFVAKEILLNKLQGFMAIAGSNPAYMSMIDVREMLEQIWDATEIGKKNPVYSEEVIQQKQAEAANQQQIQMQQAKQDKASEMKMQGEINAQIEAIKAAHPNMTPEELAIETAKLENEHNRTKVDGLKVVADMHKAILNHERPGQPTGMGAM